MDPIIYSELQNQVDDSIKKLAEIKERIHNLYLKLGPAKETVRLIEKEKAKAKKYKRKTLSQTLNETDSLSQDADNSLEGK